MLILRAINVDNQLHGTRGRSDGVQALFARYNPVLAEKCVGIAENKRRAFESDAVVFLPALALLAKVPESGYTPHAFEAFVPLNSTRSHKYGTLGS